MKYYLIETYTCYCGEHTHHYLAIPEGKSLEDHDILLQIDEWVYDNANEWWDDDAVEAYDGDFDAYLSECGYDVEEISEEEYNLYKDF